MTATLVELSIWRRKRDNEMEDDGSEDKRVMYLNLIELRTCARCRSTVSGYTRRWREKNGGEIRIIQQ
jgi:hypothetical protein